MKEAFAHQAAAPALKPGESIPECPRRPESRLVAQMALCFSLHQRGPCGAEESRVPAWALDSDVMACCFCSNTRYYRNRLSSLLLPSFLPFCFRPRLSHTLSFCCPHAGCLSQLQAHSLRTHTLTLAFMVGFMKRVRAVRKM